MKSLVNFQQREVQWDNERVTRFWSWMANEPEFSSEYFARVFGNVLIHLARKRGLANRSKVLDYGCGPGFLLERLTKFGFSCAGVEFSDQTAGTAHNGLRIGPPSNYVSGEFDFAFFIETIEHLDDVALDISISEIKRLLKPDGRILITTPYRERLGIGKTMCPDCGAVFHRMQHVRSWSEESLRKYMESSGFKTFACWGTTFMRTPLEMTLINTYRTVKSKLLGGEPLRENLIYVGAKC